MNKLSPLEYIANLPKKQFDEFEVAIKILQSKMNLSERDALIVMIRALAKSSKSKISFDLDLV